jgi:hypothetical protein
MTPSVKPPVIVRFEAILPKAVGRRDSSSWPRAENAGFDLLILPFRTHQAERPDRHARCASTMFGEVQHAAMGKTAAKDVAEEGGH